MFSDADKADRVMEEDGAFGTAVVGSEAVVAATAGAAAVVEAVELKQDQSVQPWTSHPCLELRLRWPPVTVVVQIVLVGYQCW